MAKKKSAVEQYWHQKVHIQSGLIFSMGEEIAPEWRDVQYVLAKLYTHDYAQHLLPDNLPAEVLIGGNREQMDYLVPLILRGIDLAIDAGKIQPVLDPAIVVTAYVLAWYWYRCLHGPKPIYDPMRHIRTRITQPLTLTCPACNTVYEPPKRYVNASAKVKSFIRWMPKHMREYHKWDVK